MSAALALTPGWGFVLGANDAGRVAGWRQALEAWALATVGQPFAWGRNDCAMLAFEAIGLQQGRDLGGLYRGQYASDLGAQRFQLRRGITLATELVRAGCRPIPVSGAQEGDILAVEAGPYVCGHVLFGARSLSSTPETGVVWVKTAELVNTPGLVAYSARRAEALS